jgi:hypothetical protein
LSGWLSLTPVSERLPTSGRLGDIAAALTRTCSPDPLARSGHSEKRPGDFWSQQLDWQPSAAQRSRPM